MGTEGPVRFAGVCARNAVLVEHAPEDVVERDVRERLGQAATMTRTLLTTPEEARTSQDPPTDGDVWGGRELLAVSHKSETQPPLEKGGTIKTLATHTTYARKFWMAISLTLLGSSVTFRSAESCCCSLSVKCAEQTNSSLYILRCKKC